VTVSNMPTSPDGAWQWNGEAWVPTPAGPTATNYAPQTPYGFAPSGYAPQPRAAVNGMAIASMVLGILWIYWIGSVLALIFGYVAKGQIREGAQTGGGMATAGIVLGWVGVGFLLLTFVIGALGSI
jgi:Domain of unknown function (DUF4190)